MGSIVFRDVSETPSTSEAGRFVDGLRAVPVLPHAPVSIHSELWFDSMARDNTGALLRAVESSVIQNDAVLLSRAAQAFALSTSHHLHVVRWLRGLLRHERPFVRESALYGLERFISADESLRIVVETVAETDLSPGVREAAAEVLERVLEQ
jgi:hypothetical protein